MKKVLLLIALMMPLCIMAENKENRELSRHEIRIGIGDALLGQLGINGQYEAPAIPPSAMLTQGMSAEEAHAILSQTYYYGDTYHMSPHFFLGYQYRFNSWFGFGVEADMLGSTSTYVVMNGYGDNRHTEKESMLHFALIPEARFTYFHREKVNLYSAIGLGVAMSYTFGKDPYCGWSPAIQTTLLGLSVGSNHWFGTFELGSLFEPPVGVIGHKLFSASFGYRF